MITAEIRWFWRGTAPARLQAWFRDPGTGYGSAGGGSAAGRTDEYLRDPKQMELGVKTRGGGKGVELKSLAAMSQSPLAAGPFAGSVELWTKVSSSALELEPGLLVRIHKRRWLRRFDTGTNPPDELALGADEKPVSDRPLPGEGCNVELTKVTVCDREETWWTLGLEAFGTLARIESSLAATAALLARRNPPPLAGGIVASYPAWLATVVE